jgi:5-methylcytosine-specific restriction endonuclease McrA
MPAKSKPSWRDDKLSSAARGYGYRWRVERDRYLRDNPLCVMCRPRVVPAQVVDHINPHKGNQSLFWDHGNWQSLCKLHHDSHKQSFELTGEVRGCDAKGIPIDAAHHWR